MSSLYILNFPKSVFQHFCCHVIISFSQSKSSNNVSCLSLQTTLLRNLKCVSLANSWVAFYRPLKGIPKFHPPLWITVEFSQCDFLSLTDVLLFDHYSWLPFWDLQTSTPHLLSTTPHEFIRSFPLFLEIPLKCLRFSHTHHLL